MPEDIELWTNIVYLTAVDEEDFGVNADVLYSVAGGNGSSLFDVQAQNGSVFVKASLTGKIGQWLAITVRAEDQGSPKKSSQSTVSFLVTSQNANQPNVCDLYTA